MEKGSKMTKNFQLLLIAIACLTVGLAPFNPEPHIWGKLKWIWGGANNMQIKDWLDFILHGSPWFLLVIKALRKR